MIRDTAIAQTAGEPAHTLDGMLKPEPWVADALCAQIGDDTLWFPKKGGSTVAAKEICARCDVAAECLEYALRTRERHGIYGGMSARERAKLLRGAA